MRYILTISCLLTSLWALAQPVALPLTSNPILQEYAKTHPEEARPELKSPSASLTLPFMDDFSYAGPYPSIDLWMDNDVFVNNTLGIAPPSIGVATLDGLDAEGLPYADTEGWSDTLTSQVIDLSIYDESFNVVLSFFAQPQGLGDAPESIDRLVLEFKSDSVTWIEVANIPGSSTDVFQYHAITLGSQYLGFDEFQFRFRNHSARTGFIDLWHIDYVKMDANRTEEDESFEDVCFTEAPRSYLREFTAMPWRHYFVSNPIALGATNLNIGTVIRNHTNVEKTIDVSFTAEEITTDLTIFTRDGNTTLSPMLSTEYDLYPPNIQNAADWAIGSLSPNLIQAKVITQYILDAPNQEMIDDQQNFNETNDTVTTETTFSNYFSYDDGTAEYNVGLDGEGSQAAVFFQPIVDDVLNAIQIHIPYAADDVSAGQFFTLKVWKSDPNLGEPMAEPIFRKQYSPQYGEGIGGFHTYETDPIPLTGGQGYFIGWEQNTLADYGIPIGMDKNNPQVSNKNYYNLGLGWQPFPDNLPGALMIRAVVDGDPFVGIESALNANEIAQIFPNPVNDNLFINLKSNNYENYQIEIYNSAGQIIHNNQLQASISVNTLANGVYFIRIKDNNTDAIYYEKFVKN